jgi:hypothetical protein
LVAASVLLRLPYVDTPLTADEGGYAEIARLWSHGRSLYGSVWVDRPQGLIAVFRGALAAGLTSTVALRGVAIGAAALVALAVVRVGLESGSRRFAITCGVLAVSAGASPFIEGFTLSGELLASVFATAAIAILLQFERTASLPVLATAGLVAGSALVIKQSAFDAVAGIAAYLILTRRRAAVGRLSVFLAAAAAPLAVAFALSGDPGGWAQAVIGYGAHASFGGRSAAGIGSQFVSSLPAAAKTVGPLCPLAAIGWKRAPLLLRCWLLAAIAGVCVGGSFHAHYYLQAVVPLAIVAACGAQRLGSWSTFAAAGIVLAFAVPYWTASDQKQAAAIWPHDPHLQTDSAVASYVRLHTLPSQRVYVMWAAADIYYLADRAPTYRYLWLRNLETIRGAVAGADRMLASRAPALVVEAQLPRVADPSGRTGALLARDYRPVAEVDGVRIWRPRAPLS